MENFNKNWLAILLVAVIFSTLGYLVGKTNNQHHIMKMHGHDMGEMNIDVEVDDAEDGLVKVDTIMKDGKQIIIKEIKKRKRK